MFHTIKPNPSFQFNSIQFNSIYSNQSFVDTVINKVWRVTKMNDGYGPRKAQLMIGAHLHNNTQL